MYILIIFWVGLEVEGLYRIVGFYDEVESIRMVFDKGIY